MPNNKNSQRRYTQANKHVEGIEAAKHAFDIGPIVNGTAIGGMGLGILNGAGSLAHGHGLDQAIVTGITKGLIGAGLGAAAGGIYSLFKKDPPQNKKPSPPVTNNTHMLLSNDDNLTDEQVISRIAFARYKAEGGDPSHLQEGLTAAKAVKAKQKELDTKKEEAKEAALNEFGITKEALNMGMIGKGIRGIAQIGSKIPAAGALFSGALGAYNGYQSGGIGGAITHGALGAATGSMGLMGIPLQMAGEHVLNKMEAPTPPPMSPFQYGE